MNLDGDSGVLSRSKFFSVNRIRVFVVLSSLLAISVFFRVGSADAQQSRSLSLLSRSAVLKADERRRANPSHSESALNEYSTLAEALRADTIDSVLLSSRYESDFFDDLRGLQYLKYVSNLIDVDRLDPLENATLAERLFLLRTAQSLIRHIETTPLERYFRELAEWVRTLRSYTTFTVVEEREGNFAVSTGQDDCPSEMGDGDSSVCMEAGSKHHVVHRRLIEFKFHASANHGIEPRVRLGELFVLRYDPLNQDFLFELSQRF